MNQARLSTRPAAEKRQKPEKRFGVDHAHHQLVLGKLRLPLPKSRLARMSIGVALIGGGFLGFLPILGFWMLPLGFVLLSQDSAVVRRWRRRLFVWWGRKRQKS